MSQAVVRVEATGLRRGELLGLKWEDIDLERGDLRVKRQPTRISGEISDAFLLVGQGVGQRFDPHPDPH